MGTDLTVTRILDAHYPDDSSNDQCYLTVRVQNNGFDGATKHVVSTTANGQMVHGQCSPGVGGSTADADGFWTRRPWWGMTSQRTSLTLMLMVSIALAVSVFEKKRP